jgi:hypothetical protein
MNSFTVPLWIVLGMVPSVWTRGASGPASQVRQDSAEAGQLEDFEQRIGPLQVKGQRFTVVLHKKRVPGGNNPDFQETVARMEIRDAAGTLHYEKTFPYEVAGDEFSETLDVSAQEVKGTQGEALLLTYGTLPSAPLGGRSWQVFGLFNGKLVPFSPPVFTEGGLIEDKPGEKVVQASREPKLQPDVLRFRVWSGNFFVIVPLRVDWLLAKMSLAWRCFKMTAKGQRPICEFSVEADRVSQEDDTFVRLFPEAEEGFTPAHVIVKKDSKVEILAAEAEAVWDEDAQGVGLSIGDDPWLKVRIDGKEGWIHTQEDLIAIGLQQTG